MGQHKASGKHGKAQGGASKGEAAQGDGPRVRLDQWLWAARFYKTRALAQDAIEHGRVRLGDQKLKASRVPQVGDVLTVRNEGGLWEVIVRDLSSVRGPAPVARMLYTETPSSISAREQARQARSYAADPSVALRGRPTKRDRRELDGLEQQHGDGEVYAEYDPDADEDDEDDRDGDDRSPDAYRGAGSGYGAGWEV